MLGLLQAPVYESGSGSNAILRGLETFTRDWELPTWMLWAMAVQLAVAIVMALISVVAMLSVWLERKISGHIQCRYGPMYVGGWHGWAQTIADGVKLLVKEDLVPKGSDRILFMLAPALVLAAMVGAMAVYPLAPGFFFADVNLGLFTILALTSMTTIGVVMAGWASNSKWSLYGAMREAAQVVAYEVPFGIALLIPVMATGSFNLLEVSAAQSGMWGLDWNIFPWVWPTTDQSGVTHGPNNLFMIPAFLLFFVAALAETKRAPFDLPEAESELVAGFMTEYSGIRWSFFFMEEYAAMFLVSAVSAVFWFGGFESPLTHVMRGFAADGGTIANVLYQLTAASTLLVKSFLLVCLMMWLRWTLPRIRIDQVMTMGYKYLTPLALATVLGAGLWEAIF